MTSTYEKIATTTTAGSTNSVTFSSIPATYTDLILITNILPTWSDQNTYLQFNSDTATNYSQTGIYGNGSVVVSDRESNTSTPAMAYTSGNNVAIYQIMNYSNTTTYKTTIMRASQANLIVQARVMLWRSTSAINAIKLAGGGSGNIPTGSTFTLYGIKSE
jgi:hypothetical protein